ncbi:MAG: sugar ABC transporter permease [Chloroflexi bacterium]|nr:sugar ABC transporter permease [Chloroflexota bacterium]
MELRRKMYRHRKLLQHIEGWLFASPWILGLLTFFLIPMLASIYLSLTSYNIVEPAHYIGLGNYKEIAQDPLIWHSLKVTSVYALISVPLSLFLGLLLALLLNQDVRGIAFWRTIYYLPSVVSGVAVALLWEWLFNGRFGLVNYLLEILFGIEGPNWLADSRTAIWAFVVIRIWMVGGSMLINLAALQGVPTALYEAAEIDGANAWRKFLHITIPMISPVIFFNLVMGIIGALKSFDLFYIMTGGGPNNSTLTFMLHLYRTAFEYMRMGYGCAMAWVLFIYLVILTAIVFRSSGTWVYYESIRRK